MLSSLLESRARCRAQNHATNALDRAWLRSLDSDCRRAIQRARSVERKPLNNHFNSEIVDLVDLMMLRLHQYAKEFNLAVAWNLHVTATPPSFVTEAVSFNSHRETTHAITTYRARLATRLWSLILRAEKNRLEFFLIPTHNVLGLSKTEHEYPPVSVLGFDGQRFWQDGRPISVHDGGERLCRFVFHMLVSKCIQDVENKTSDPFNGMLGYQDDEHDVAQLLRMLQPPTQLANKEAQAGEVLPPGKDEAFCLGDAIAESAWETFPLLGPITNQYTEPATMTRYDIYNDVLLCFAFLAERIDVAVSDLADHGAQAFRRRDLNVVKRCCLDLVAAESHEAQVRELRVNWTAMNEISELLADCTEYGALSHRSGPASADICNDLPSALRCLIESVEVVAEAMIECGAKAFSARDFERVDRFRKFAASALLFKAHVEGLRDSWYSSVPDAALPLEEPDATARHIMYVNSIKAISLAAS
jgi:hypothetical protein